MSAQRARALIEQANALLEEAGRLLQGDKGGQKAEAWPGVPRESVEIGQDGVVSFNCRVCGGWTARMLQPGEEKAGVDTLCSGCAVVPIAFSGLPKGATWRVVAAEVDPPARREDYPLEQRVAYLESLLEGGGSDPGGAE